MAANAGSIIAQLGLDTTIGADLAKARGELNTGLSGLASGSLGALGSVVKTIGYVGIAAAGMAATVGGVAVNSFKNFEQSATNAASVLGLTGDAFQQAKDNIESVSQVLGQETVYSSKDAADALYNLASAGIDVAHVTAQQMQPALNLAAGTQYSLAGTTELVASTMSQFKISFNDSARIADVYAKAIAASQANMEKLAVSMNYAGPAMAGVNGSLEETTAILSVLYNAGLDAEIAGTGVRTMIASLLSPTASANAALSEMGLTVDQVNPELHNMTEIISLLGSKGMTMAQSIAIFGREGANAALIATQNSDALKQLTTDLINSGGAAGTIAAQQMDTLAGSLAHLKGAYENVLINIGKAKAPDLRNMFATLADAAPQVEAFALSVLGFISDLTSRLRPAIGLIEEIGQTIYTTFQKIIMQVGGGGKGGLAAGIANLVTRTLDAVRIVVSAAAPYIQAVIVGIVTFIRNLISELGPAWASLQAIGAGIKTIFSNIFTVLAGAGAGMGSGLAAGLSVILNTVASFIASFVTLFAKLSTQAVPVVKEEINSIKTVLLSLITFLQPIITRFQKLWDSLPQIFNQVSEKLQPAFATLQAVWSSVPGLFNGLLAKLQPVLSKITAVWDQLPGIFDKIRPALETAWGWLSGVFKNLWQIAQDFVNNLGPTWDNLKSIWESLVTIFKTAWATLQPVINEIKTQWSAFFDAISGDNAGASSGIGGALASVINAISGAIAYLLKWVAEHPKITEFAMTLVKSAGMIIAAIPGAVTALWNFGSAVAEWIGGAVETVKGYYASWQAIWAEYGPSITGTVAGIITTLSGWYNDIKTWLGSAVQYVQDQYNIWSERWTNFKTTVDTYLSPIITTLESWYNSIITYLGGAVQYVQDQYTAWTERWSNFKLAVDNATQPIITTLSGWKTDIETYLGGAVKIVTDILNGDWTSAWNGFETAIGTAKDNILKKLGEWKDGLTTKFDEVKKAISGFLSDWGGLWGSVEGETADATNGESGGNSGGMLSKVWDGLKSAFNTLREELGKKYDEIKTAASTFITELGGVLGGIAGAFSGISAAVGLAISGILTEINTDLNNIAVAVKTFLETQWTTAWTLITQAITTANTNIGLAIDAINTTVTSVLGLINTTLQNFNASWQASWAAVVSSTQTAGSNLSTALDSVRGDVLLQTGYILEDMDIFRSEWAAVWTGINGDIQTAAGQIAAAIMDMATQAATAMDSFVSTIQSGLQNGLNAIYSQQDAYYSAGKALTDAYASGMEAGASTTKNKVAKMNTETDKQLPHSPAKEGVFRRLPKWDTVFVTPMLDSLKKMGTIKETLAGQLSDIKSIFSLGKGLPVLNLTGNLEGFSKSLHKLLDTPASSTTSSGTTSNGGVWSKTTTQNGTTTTTSGNMTQAQAAELLAKLEKLIQAQAPQINIKDVKLDQAYNFQKLIADVEKYQTAKRRQSGAYI